MQQIALFLSFILITFSNADEVLLKNGQAWINVNILEDLETDKSITIHTSMGKKIVLKKSDIEQIRLKKFDTLKKSELVVMTKEQFDNRVLKQDDNNFHSGNMVGIKIGKNFTRWFPNPSAGPYEFDNSSAYSFCIFKLIKLHHRIYLDYEFVFSWESFHMNSSIVSAKELYFFYEVPVLINYFLLENQYKILRIFAGPAVGGQDRFVLHGSGQGKFPIFYGISGLAFQYQHFLLELRYKYSLTDAYNTKYTEGNIRGKLATLSISAGYLF